MAKNIKVIPTPALDKNLTPELLARAICARRTQSNLSLEDAAALCGVAKQTLMNIEHAEGNSQMTTILQICAGLGLKLRILPWVDEENEKNNEWK